MFKYILFASLLPILAQASDISCLLTENAQNQDYESTFVVPLDSHGDGNYQIKKSAGGLTQAELLIQNSQSRWTMIDPSTGKPLITLFSAHEGFSSRIQMIPNVSTNDYLMLDCGRGEYTPLQKKPSSFKCLLTEKNSQSEYEQTFIVPVATGGHDIFPLPQAKISPLGGWVLGYNGVVVVFFQNQNTYSGITVLGPWDSDIGVSWFPSSDETKASLICQPQ